MRDYKANTFQMNNSIFQFGLTPIQFVVYSYLKYCTGNRFCLCCLDILCPTFGIGLSCDLLI